MRFETRESVKNNNSINITWFKRDLRLNDHAPLSAAIRSGTPTVPLYIVEPDYWAQKFSSVRHWQFVLDCVEELRIECDKLGQPLVIRKGVATAVFQELLKQFKIDGIFVHQETGNDWSRRRDQGVRDWCAYNSIRLHEFPTNGVVRDLDSRDKWSKVRDSRMIEPIIPAPSRLRGVSDIHIGEIPSRTYPCFGYRSEESNQRGGSAAGKVAVATFLRHNSKKYLRHISEPHLSKKYCSRISPHLTWGSLSVKEVIKSLQSRFGELDNSVDNSWKRNLRAFESRLAWRCHFIQKLEDQPSIETACMHSAFEHLRSVDSGEQFYNAWSIGMTGYPIVDACMRSLNHGGWITFRMRAMLVSFASYNLWIDWRRSGYHLAKLFTDYEPGIHYSQLQMQSGVTSINAIRIYNPLKQSFANDPGGHFIRSWVPELKAVPEPWVHQPWKMSGPLQSNFGCILGKDYPKPIVDHEITAKLARQRIKAASQGKDFRAESRQVFDKLGSRQRSGRHRPKEVSRQLTLSL